VDEFSGATLKGKETNTPSIARVTKVLLLRFLTNYRLEREERSWSITYSMLILLDRS
jgi:hypothetical protein